MSVKQAPSSRSPLLRAAVAGPSLCGCSYPSASGPWLAPAVFQDPLDLFLLPEDGLICSPAISTPGFLCPSWLLLLLPEGSGGRPAAPVGGERPRLPLAVWCWAATAAFQER